MNVVYASSDQYAFICGVSLVSLLRTNKEVQNIVVYIIDNGISDEAKGKLQEICDSCGRQLVFLDPPSLEKQAGVKIETGQWNIATFYRLFIHRLLPNEDKALYLDCDTLIRKPLADFYNMDISETMIAGADDCRCDLYKEDLGYSGGLPYINNGVILLNLARLRENDPLEDMVEFIRQRNGDITYVDQGVLNGILSPRHEIKVIPPVYNAQRVFFDFSFKEILRLRKPEYHCSEEEYCEAISNPAVVHFTPVFFTATRPWQIGDTHPFTKEWIETKMSSPWRERPLDEFKPSMKKRIMLIFSKCFPRRFVIAIASIAHSFLYPKRRIKIGRKYIKRRSRIYL